MILMIFVIALIIEAFVITHFFIMKNGASSKGGAITGPVLQKTIEQSSLELKNDVRIYKIFENTPAISQIYMGSDNEYRVAWINFGFTGVVAFYRGDKVIGVYETGREITSVQTVDYGEDLLFCMISTYRSAGSSQYDSVFLYNVYSDGSHLSWTHTPVAAESGIPYTSPYAIVSPSYGSLKIVIHAKLDGNASEEVEYYWSDETREFTLQ